MQGPYELKDLIDTTKLVQKFLPKQMDIEKNIRHYQEKGSKGYTFTPHHQRDPSRLSKQSLFQILVAISVPKQIAKQKIFHKEG